MQVRDRTVPLPDSRTADEIALGVASFYAPPMPDDEGSALEEERALAALSLHVLPHADGQELALAAEILRGGLHGFRLVRKQSVAGHPPRHGSNECRGGCLLLAFAWREGMSVREATTQHFILAQALRSRGDASTASRIMTWWDRFPPERTMAKALAAVLAEQARRAAK